MSTIPTITPEQKAAAAREAKAAKERERRTILKQLEKAGLPQDVKALDGDQRARAVESAEKKAGLSGKALASYILEGKSVTAAIAEAKENAMQEKKEERTRANITRSQDPEASELAVNAKKLAPEVKSAFLPKDAREFIDRFTVELDGTQKIKVGRKDDEVAIVFKRADLRRFAQAGEKDKAIRGELALLGKGTRLWGRKLGLMILATDATLH